VFKNSRKIPFSRENFTPFFQKTIKCHTHNKDTVLPHKAATLNKVMVLPHKEATHNKVMALPHKEATLNKDTVLPHKEATHNKVMELHQELNPMVLKHLVPMEPLKVMELHQELNPMVLKRLVPTAHLHQELNPMGHKPLLHMDLKHPVLVVQVVQTKVNFKDGEGKCTVNSHLNNLQK